MSNMTISDLEEQIKQKTQQFNQEVKDLEAQLAAAKLESPDQQLAKQLHSMLCTWNHTDGCSWFYEMKNKQDDWTGHAHGEYLKKAQMITHQCKQRNIPVQTAMEVYKMVKGT